MTWWRRTQVVVDTPTKIVMAEWQLSIDSMRDVTAKNNAAILALEARLTVNQVALAMLMAQVASGLSVHPEPKRQLDLWLQRLSKASDAIAVAQPAAFQENHRQALIGLRDLARSALEVDG